MGLSPARLEAWAERRGLPLLRRPGSADLAFQRPGAPSQLVRWIPRPERSLCTLALQAAFEVEPAAVPRFEHALAEANAQIVVGAWVLEPSGQVFFRLAVPTRGILYDDAALDQLVSLVLQVVDGQSAALLQAATGVREAGSTRPAR